MDGFEYVETLSINEKLIFVKLIVKLISGDGKISDDERAFVKVLSKQYRISSDYSDEINRHYSEEELLEQVSVIKDRRKSLYLIKELLSVANADEELEDREIDFIIKVSNVLDVEDEKVAEINQLVLDRLAWIDEYRTVMEFED